MSFIFNLISYNLILLKLHKKGKNFCGYYQKSVYNKGVRRVPDSKVPGEDPWTFMKFSDIKLSFLTWKARSLT